MSKRVSNSRTNRFRKGTIRARQKVRYGWRKRKMFAEMAELRERVRQQHALAGMTREDVV